MFWAGNCPLSEPSSVAISRTSLATAGSFGMGDGVADADHQRPLPPVLLLDLDGSGTEGRVGVGNGR